MTTWAVFDPNRLMPSTLVTAATRGGSAVSGFLDDAAGALDLPSIPSIPSLPSPSAAVINAVLDTISSLLKAGRLHILAVPIAKTAASKPSTGLPPTLPDLQNTFALALGPPTTAAANAYVDMVTKAGGNAGFYRAFATSLTDPGDPNRPQYDAQSDAVAMAVVLIGSPRYVTIVNGASALDQIVAPKGGNGLAARTVPIPQNLRARVVGAVSKDGIGVRLDWDVPTTFSSPYFPGVSTTVRRYAVIRSTDARAQNARSVLDFFPTQSLAVGMTNGAATVVAIGTGKNSAYLDTTALVDTTTPAYYCVAWECDVVEGATTTTLPFDRVSNVSKTIPKKPPPPQTGTSPNWVATGSAIDAFPAIADVADRLIEGTRVLVTPPTSSSDRLGVGIDLLASAARRLSARASELSGDAARVAASLSRPIPSMYVTTMTSGTGGNAFLLSELSRRLGDQSDSSRPPFDNGEYVCGACFVAGAARLADLAPIIAFFEALFGSAAAAATNPLLGLLAAIDTAVTQPVPAVFHPNMKPFPAGTPTSGAAGTTTGTDGGDATGIDPVTGVPPVASRPAIAADGAAVARDDPANPNAGDTNITPTSELC